MQALGTLSHLFFEQGGHCCLHFRECAESFNNLLYQVAELGFKSRSDWLWNVYVSPLCKPRFNEHTTKLTYGCPDSVLFLLGSPMEAPVLGLVCSFMGQTHMAAFLLPRSWQRSLATL